MPGFYQTFTSNRTTVPDPAQLLVQLRALDATAGVATSPDGRTFNIKKSTAWTAPQITAAQNVVDTSPAVTPQSVAQAEIDAWPIAQKALALALIDETNRLRAALRGLGVANLPDVSVAAALAAVRAKAGTLT